MFFRQTEVEILTRRLIHHRCWVRHVSNSQNLKLNFGHSTEQWSKHTANLNKQKHYLGVAYSNLLYINECPKSKWNKYHIDKADNAENDWCCCDGQMLEAERQLEVAALEDAGFVPGCMKVKGQPVLRVSKLSYSPVSLKSPAPADSLYCRRTSAIFRENGQKAERNPRHGRFVPATGEREVQR